MSTGSNPIDPIHAARFKCIKQNAIAASISLKTLPRHRSCSPLQLVRSDIRLPRMMDHHGVEIVKLFADHQSDVLVNCNATSLKIGHQIFLGHRPYLTKTYYQILHSLRGHMLFQVFQLRKQVFWERCSSYGRRCSSYGRRCSSYGRRCGSFSLSWCISSTNWCSFSRSWCSFNLPKI